LVVEGIRTAEGLAKIVHHHDRFRAESRRPPGFSAAFWRLLARHTIRCCSLAVAVLNHDGEQFASRCSCGAPPAVGSTRSSSGYAHPDSGRSSIDVPLILRSMAAGLNSTWSR
jgi:hypothetical protein